MRKFIWLILALGGLALLKKRADETGSWSAATDSVQKDLADAWTQRNEPSAPSLWSRFFGSKKPTSPAS